MSKQFLLIVAVIVVGLIALFTFTKPKNTTSGTNSNGQTSKHIQGKGAKNVTLQEYGDYQCPFCGAFYPVVKQVAAQYNNDIFFQFSNLPLFQIHNNAIAGARAAEAASLQGKFWEMHDMLYENQSESTGWVVSSTPLTFFTSFAQQLGLDTNKFTQDYSSSAVNDTIQADLAAFKKTGQQEATPSFFIDGKFVPLTNLYDANGQPSAAKFAQVINAEIAAKNK
ncbi:MAG TPA: thioredoxin domain-containing protein [Patescibacteria group bacterium]|nr:thioredoxin domain-containing protein [Patescibacteria group bacterium]